MVNYYGERVSTAASYAGLALSGAGYYAGLAFSGAAQYAGAAFSGTVNYVREARAPKPTAHELTEKITAIKERAILAVKSPERLITELRTLSKETINIHVLKDIREVLQAILRVMHSDGQYDRYIDDPFISLNELIELLKVPNNAEEYKESVIGEVSEADLNVDNVKKVMEDEKIRRMIEATFVAYAVSEFSKSYLPFTAQVAELGTIVTDINNIAPEDLQGILRIIKNLNGAIKAFNQKKSENEKIETLKRIVFNIKDSNEIQVKKFSDLWSKMLRCVGLWKKDATCTRLVGFGLLFSNKEFGWTIDAITFEEDPRLHVGSPNMVSICCISDRSVLLLMDDDKEIWRFPGGGVGKESYSEYAAEDALGKETEIHVRRTYDQINSSDVIDVKIFPYHQMHGGLRYPNKTRRTYGVFMRNLEDRLLRPGKKIKDFKYVPFTDLIHNGEPVSEIVGSSGKSYRVSSNVMKLSSAYLEYMKQAEPVGAEALEPEHSRVFDPQKFLATLNIAAASELKKAEPQMRANKAVVDAWNDNLLQLMQKPAEIDSK